MALVILLMSGLQIFNAHPTLNWGKSSYDGHAPVLEIRAEEKDGNLTGITQILGKSFHTTGLFGASRDATGDLAERAFPSWMTIPGNQFLAMGRRWHFLLAWIFVINGLFYIAYSIASRHLSEDLSPTRRDLRSIGRSILDHLRFRHPRGEDAKRYNVLQKFTYLIVIFVLLPLMMLMGLAMSPRLDTLLRGWVDVVGGRQSARTLHFLGATLIVMFVFVHVFEVAISGLWNNLRSMISGGYDIEKLAEPLERRPITGESSSS